MSLILKPNRVYIINPEQPREPRVFAYAWEREATESITGSVEQYANGRKVSLTYADPVTFISLTLYDLPAVMYRTLQDWLGQIVLFRDRHGRKVFGTYFELGVLDFRDSAYDIDLELEPVTYAEVV